MSKITFDERLNELITLTTINIPNKLTDAEIISSENSRKSFSNLSNYSLVYPKIVKLEDLDFQRRAFKKNYFYALLQYDQFNKLHKVSFDKYFFGNNIAMTSEEKKNIYTMQSCVAPIYLYLSKAIRYILKNGNNIDEEDVRFLGKIIQTRNKLIEHNYNPSTSDPNTNLDLTVELDEHTSIGSDKEVHCQIIDLQNKENTELGYIYPMYDFERSSSIVNIFIDTLIES